METHQTTDNEELVSIIRAHLVRLQPKHDQLFQQLQPLCFAEPTLEPLLTFCTQNNLPVADTVREQFEAHYHQQDQLDERVGDLAKQPAYSLSEELPSDQELRKLQRRIKQIEDRISDLDNNPSFVFLREDLSRERSLKQTIGDSLTGYAKSLEFHQDSFTATIGDFNKFLAIYNEEKSSLPDLYAKAEEIQLQIEKHRSINSEQADAIEQLGDLQTRLSTMTLIAFAEHVVSGIVPVDSTPHSEYFMEWVKLYVIHHQVVLLKSIVSQLDTKRSSPAPVDGTILNKIGYFEDYIECLSTTQTPLSFLAVCLGAPEPTPTIQKWLAEPIGEMA